MKFPYKLIKVKALEFLQAEHQRLSISNQSATSFIKEIENGNLSNEFQAATASADGLTLALLSMQQQLQKIAADEKARNWATQGLAQFSEILRADNVHAQAFYQKVISHLVKYMDANQGGLFLVEDEDPNNIEIALVSCYAYNKQKFINKKVTPGEGLIGQCYLEKDIIYLTDVPKNYINISSGLGTARPACVLIVPLKVNQHVLGFVELASFQAFSPYQIEFLEKLGESIASTISTVKINERTRKLLEESQQQAEMMRAQEEEMRQNMEELSATQEEMKRSMEESFRLQRELDARMVVLNKTALLTESDPYGTITYVNDKFCQVSGWTRGEAIGKPHNIVRHPDNAKSLYKEMWQTIKSGGIFQGVFPNKKKNGDTYWVDSTIAPVLDEHGNIIKYIGIRFDITEQVKREQESQQQAEELKAQEEELRQNMEELHAIHEQQAEMQKELAASEEALKKQVEALSEARAEIEKVRQIEQERANQRVESQKKATEKMMMKFKDNEQKLKQEMEMLLEEVNMLKTNKLN